MQTYYAFEEITMFIGCLKRTHKFGCDNEPLLMDSVSDDWIILEIILETFEFNPASRIGSLAFDFEQYITLKLCSGLTYSHFDSCNAFYLMSDRIQFYIKNCRVMVDDWMRRDVLAKAFEIVWKWYRELESQQDLNFFSSPKKMFGKIRILNFWNEIATTFNPNTSIAI